MRFYQCRSNGTNISDDKTDASEIRLNNNNIKWFFFFIFVDVIVLDLFQYKRKRVTPFSKISLSDNNTIINVVFFL